MWACRAALQVISFAGELLSNAEGLLRDGLHTSEVADGYTKAADKASRAPVSSSAAFRRSPPPTQ